MELEIKAVARMLDAIAVERGDAVAENVLIVVAQMDDEATRWELLGAVADGLGVPLD